MSAADGLPQIPGYRLSSVLRTGGMSTLYVGEALAGAAGPPGSAIAVKLLHRQLLTEVELVMRFHNETALLLETQSASLVRAYASGRLPDGAPYLVLERLSHSLADVLDGHATGLPERAALVIARALATALAELHGCGVIHRDLKPANIMFASGDPEDLGDPGDLRLIDLGLAKIDRLRPSPSGVRALPLLPVSTAETALLGTCEYMAPEQCLNPKGVGAPADVYSLGVILYQLLTGQLPFRDACTKRLIGMHLWDKPPLRVLRRRELRALLADLLSKEPAARPTAAAASVRLATLIAGR